MKQVVPNIVTLAAVLISVLAIFIRYLVPIYPAEGVDPLKVTFNLALAQYGGVIVALAGAGYIAWKETSLARRIRIILLLVVVSVLCATSAIRGNAETQKSVVIPHPKYRFTTDWVSRNASLWTQTLSTFKDKPNVRALEVGSFEGRSALWFLENILTHPTASITCIDVWVDAYEDLFDENIKAYGNPGKVIKLKDRSDVVLKTLKPQGYDFIYIDGSHVAKDVLTDAVLAWDLLKPGGIIIFDDYDWAGVRSWIVPHHTPKTAINAFLKVFGPYLDVLHQDYQLVVRKKERVDLDTSGTLRSLLISIQRLLG